MYTKLDFSQSYQQFRSYLGNHYHRFFPNFNVITSSSIITTRIRTIKTLAVLIHYNTKLPVILNWEGSPYGLGVALMHTFPDGSEHPI